MVEPQIDSEDIIKILVEKVASLQKDISQLKGAPADDIEIKATTGDYAVADSWNGRRVLNTFDNTYKIFAEGAWRQIIAY
jgi:hypothetical protein